jgi:hypothetical protein
VLEPDEVKVSSPVLRGGGNGNIASLPDRRLLGVTIMNKKLSLILVSSILVVALAVLIGPKILTKYQAVYFAYAMDQITHLPSRSTLDKHGDGTIVADRFTYCVASCGITDIGNLRIVVPGLVFSGESSGSLVLASNSKNWSNGSTGVGNRRFTEEYKDGLTTASFGGFSFTIRDGILRLKDTEVDVLSEKRRVMFVKEDGSLISIVSLES